MERYSEGSEPYLNVFRYFSKLLSCHMAEVNAPIPVTLAKFSIGDNDINRIWLELKSDPTYRYAVSFMGEHQYAAHGGLIVYGDRNTSEPNAFHSTITVGPLQYVFHTRLDPLEKIEIRNKYPEFFEWLISKVREAKDNPIPENTLLQIGVKDEGA
jgi:hypothetical protein